MIETMINLGIPLGIVAFAMITGMVIERRHFREIEQREDVVHRIAVLSDKQYPDDAAVQDARMVTGSVVVSIDYFKRFLASLRNIFGGEVRSYCSLLDRGRREAILRMKEECLEANLIVNLRVETSSVFQGAKKQVGSIEVLAYGTAITFQKS